MAERSLTALGQQMLAQLPPVLRRSADYEGVIHVCSREIDRLEAAIEQVRAQFNPATADLLLSAWETEVRLPAGGGGGSIDERRAKVLQRLRQVLAGTEGRQWEAQITSLVGPGWSYEEHIPGDLTSPAADTIRVTLPYAPTSAGYREAQQQIRDITPAHLALEYLSAAGFTLDESELDVDGLTY